MGSWFSSPARAGCISVPAELMAQIREFKDELRVVSEQEDITRPSNEAYCIRDLAYEALGHYNSNHPDAMFRFPAQPAKAIYYIGVVYPPTEDMKGACVGFRKDLWYHLNFSACPRTIKNGDEQTFFAELRYDNSSHDLIVQTCTILEKPFRSSCALCPDESKILHPDDAEFVCGKEGHERDFFRERCAPDGTKKFFSQSDMLRMPFLLGGQTPRYRLVED